MMRLKVSSMKFIVGMPKQLNKAKVLYQKYST